MKPTLVSAIIALLLGTGAALADDQASMDSQAMAPLSLDAYMTLYPDSSSEIFTQLDSNGDGMLDQAEIDAGVEAGTIPAMDAPSDGN